MNTGKGEAACLRSRSERTLNGNKFFFLYTWDKAGVEPVSGNAAHREHVRLAGCLRLQAREYANTSIQNIYRCRVREKLVQAITGGVSNPGPPMACARSKVWQEIGNCRGVHETRGVAGWDGVVTAGSFTNGTPSQALLPHPNPAPRALSPRVGRNPPSTKGESFSSKYASNRDNILRKG